MYIYIYIHIYLCIYVECVQAVLYRVIVWTRRTLPTYQHLKQLLNVPTLSGNLLLKKVPRHRLTRTHTHTHALSLSLFLFLVLSHARTHTHTHSLSHFLHHALAHALSLARSFSFACSLWRARSLSLFLTMLAWARRFREPSQNALF